MWRQLFPSHFNQIPYQKGFPTLRASHRSKPSYVCETMLGLTKIVFIRSVLSTNLKHPSDTSVRDSVVTK